MLRYELLWQYGGLYVDADFECLRPITPLLDGVACFAARESDGRRIANGLMGATRRHPFVGQLIRGLPASAQAHRGKRPAISTGPAYLTGTHRAHLGQLTVFPSCLSTRTCGRSRPSWGDQKPDPLEVIQDLHGGPVVS
ncbi:glycosyltransferase [Nonomuraea sp. NPDC049400]|uniref:glycosyltransferase n=1 Tax=Nonomuraea sp. NPDC049400 TaxID=3364352 RepID=UPI00378CFDF8